MGKLVLGTSLPVVVDNSRTWELNGPAIPVYARDTPRVEAGLATRIRFAAANERRLEVGPALPISLTPSRGAIHGPVQVVYAAPGYEWMEYDYRVLSIEPGSLIAYWPMDEATMPVSYDHSGNGRNGLYTACAMGQPGIGDGRTCPAFNGAASFNNIYSASLAAAFNGAEGTLLIWAKVANAGVWTDGTIDAALSIGADATNYVRLWKSDANNTLICYHDGGGVLTNASAACSLLGWFCIGMTWSRSANRLKLYVNGISGAGVAGVGLFAGVPATTLACVGAQNTVPQRPWSGWLSHAALWSKALTPAQVLSLGVL